MSDKVIQLVKSPPMVAIVIGAKESGSDCPVIERLVLEAYPHASRSEISAAFKAAVDHFRDVGAAMNWLAENPKRIKTPPCGPRG
jgi:hypothetical protein